MLGRTATACLLALGLTLSASVATGQKAASTSDGTGIWLWNATLNLHVVNLTEYNLTWTQHIVSYGRSVMSPWYDSYNRFCPGAEPYRTASWRTNPSSLIEPESWDGDITFHFANQSAAADFKLHFFQENDDQGYAGEGTWVSLLPVTWPNWSNYNGSSDFTSRQVNGRWTTPVADKQMHNNMTMVSDSVVVSVYSPDNKNVVVAVQQNNSSTWGSDKDRWVGWQLNWADNDDLSCPGPTDYSAAARAH
jgi:hypothetical protein